jgi:hypothetical protein
MGQVAVQPVRKARPMPQLVQCRGVVTGCLLINCSRDGK